MHHHSKCITAYRSSQFPSSRDPPVMELGGKALPGGTWLWHKGGHGSGVPPGLTQRPHLLVQQPADDGDADEAERRHDVGNVGDHMRRIALVLQLQPRGAQVELRGARGGYLLRECLSGLGQG